MLRFFKQKNELMQAFKYKTDIEPSWWIDAIRNRTVVVFDTHAEAQGDRRKHMIFEGDYVVRQGKTILGMGEAVFLDTFNEHFMNREEFYAMNQYN